MTNQIAEQFGLHDGEVDSAPQVAQLKISEIDGYALERKHAEFTAIGIAAFARSRNHRMERIGLHHPFPAAQQTLQARKKNGQLEWFGYVIVGAGSKSL